MISISSITLPGAPLGPENPLPYFRDCAHNRAFRDVGLLPEEKAGFGYETGARILPWTRQDAIPAYVLHDFSNDCAGK